MTSRRDLLATLAALAAAPSLTRAADIDGFDPVAVRRIGQAWRELHPHITTRDLARRLFPDGRGPDALPRLRALAAADFRRGAVFAYRGWRLSDTEGALFTLLWLEAP
ncbi:hypothetical protein B7G68_09450 [Caulobacter segnis]|uniref:Uncharacterized protein n=2 Tax=Caulobacter segnis TaxID=88688 RepID=D5VJA5_CAUST|nr:hypothetical protein [Caulobacter segnis]ADG10314.1 conserved hypothetical protein [Caulobacter segnis ATCC 21756]AVQ02048.1 hypothetical protein B7G68_09450 [Caulobacter segnis]